MQRTKQLLASSILFLLSFALGLRFYPYLRLPFSNPWGVIGPPTLHRYNPANDIVRFLLLVLLPSAVLVLLCLSRATRRLLCPPAEPPRDLRRVEKPARDAKWVSWTLLLVVVVVLAGDNYRYSGGDGPLDTFHEGETLGAAVDYRAGKIPYRETIFVHGAFQDPLRSVLAFKLFGRSIAAMRTMTALLSAIKFGLLCVALYLLFGSNIGYAAPCTLLVFIFWLLKPLGVGFYTANRDIALYCFLITAVLLHRLILDGEFEARKNRASMLLFLFGVLPAVSFAYSIDRGFYLSAACVIHSFGMLFILPKKGRYRSLAILSAGYVAGILGLGLAVKWAYVDFLKFAVLIFPRYKELMDGFVYRFRELPFCIPVLLISANLFWLTRRFIGTKGDGLSGKIGTFYATYGLEALLLMLSVFCFRGALGRSDIGHVYLASAPIFILTIYALLRHAAVPQLDDGSEATHQAAMIVTVVLFVVLSRFCAPKMDWSHWYRVPLGVPDEKLIPANYAKAISFLRSHLREDERFFTMTSEASWYYFLDKPCPTRFQVVWFAMPEFYQREIVQDLERQKVKFVLFRNGSWAYTIDQIPNATRLPIVVSYLKASYVFFRKIDDHEIWIRRER